MAAVIGVLFFIVIIMALEMVESTPSIASAADPELQAEQTETLRAAIRQLREKQARLEREILEITRINSRAEVDPQGALNDLKRMNETLRSLYARIVQDRKRLDTFQSEREKLKNSEKNLLARIAEADRQIAELRLRLKSAGSGPRISYIIDRQVDRKKPWLVELSARKIRISSGLKAGAFMEFEADDLGQRVKQFLLWAKQQDKAQCYFVLLIKPSGCRYADLLRALLSKSGYETGTDLLPENWSAF